MKIAIITGPRRISAGDERLVHDVVREVIARGFQIYVGDANGVDSAVAYEAIVQNIRWYKKFPQIFQPLVSLGRTPAGLAERSTRMVREAIRDSSRAPRCSDCGKLYDISPLAEIAGLLSCPYCGNTRDPWEMGKVICIGFPNKPCPAGIVPARSWKSGGSGTWSTIALCVGHEIETEIYVIGKAGKIDGDFEKPKWLFGKRVYHNSPHNQYQFSYRHVPYVAPSLFSNSFPPLAHDALCDGYTELARANSADGN